MLVHERQVVVATVSEVAGSDPEQVQVSVRNAVASGGGPGVSGPGGGVFNFPMDKDVQPKVGDVMTIQVTYNAI